MIMDRKTNRVRNMSRESAVKWRADWTSTSSRRRRGWLNKCSAEPVSSNQRSCKKSQHCPQLRFISQLNLIKMVYWSLMSAAESEQRGGQNSKYILVVIVDDYQKVLSRFFNCNIILGAVEEPSRLISVIDIHFRDWQFSHGLKKTYNKSHKIWTAFTTKHQGINCTLSSEY